MQDMEDGARSHCHFLHNGNQPLSEGHIKGTILPFLHQVRQQCEAMEMRSGIERVEKFNIACNSGIDYQELVNQSRVLREAIESELKFRRFAYIPANRSSQLDNIDAEWEAAERQFPSAKSDIRAAVECYALDCNTASVFHAMRVVEWGLRALCASLGFRRLRQKFKKSGIASYIPIEFSEWEKILNQLQERVDKKLLRIKRGALKQQEQEFYYPMLQDIRGIRDAWRNHVMHTRQEYSPKDADSILGHVKRLMNKLGTRIREV